MIWNPSELMCEGREELMRGRLVRVSLRARADGVPMHLIGAYMPVRSNAKCPEIEETWEILDIEATRPDFLCGGDLNAEIGKDGTASDRLLNEMCTQRSLTSMQPPGPTYEKGEIKSRIDHWLVSSGLVGAMKSEGRAPRLSDHWGVRLQYTARAQSGNAECGETRPIKPAMGKLRDDDDWDKYVELTTEYVQAEMEALEQRNQEEGSELKAADKLRARQRGLLAALASVVGMKEAKAAAFKKKCGGRPMATLSKLHADVNRWTGLVNWISKGGRVVSDVRRRNSIVRVIQLQDILKKQYSLQEERVRLAAKCNEELAKAKAALDAYMSKEGDGLMEILEDAASEGEGFMQMKVFEALKEATGKDVKRKRGKEDKAWQQEERARRDPQWTRRPPQEKMSCVFKGDKKPKDGESANVVYGPAARIEIAEIAKKINKWRGYFSDEAQRLFRLAGMSPQPTAAPEDANWVDEICTFERFEAATQPIAIDTGVGSDGFSAYLLRKAPREERRAYWKDLKECIRAKQFPSEWKDVLALLVMKPGEDPRELGRRRDIWLEPHGQKILQRMLTTGEYNVVADRTVPGSQAGFTEMRGAAEQSWILRAHKEQCAMEQQPCYKAYLDYSTLFMSCVRQCQSEVEARLGVRTEVTAVMEELHRELKGRFETEWGLTPPVPIEEGNIQGAITSPVQAKLMLSVVQRVVTRTCEGYSFRTAARATPQLWFADDACFSAQSLAGIQLIFDTVWYASRVLGLTIGVKANGKKTAWSGTYWEGGEEREVTGWTIRLPDNREVPQVKSYKYLGGVETSGWKGRYDSTHETIRRKCCQMIRLIGRVPILGPEQLKRAMELALHGIIGFYARSTPVPWEVCKSIEAVRAEVLQRRGICPAAPRLPIYAPCAAGGLGHTHAYQIAASAFIDQIDRMINSDANTPAREVATAHLAAGCWKLGCRVHPLEWWPTHLMDQLGEDKLVEAWLLYRMRAGVRSKLAAGELKGTAMEQARWAASEAEMRARGPALWEGVGAALFDRSIAELGVACWRDVTDANGQWMSWAEFRSAYQASPNMEDAYRRLYSHVDHDLRAAEWKAWCQGRPPTPLPQVNSVQARDTEGKWAYEEIIATRATATCFGGTEYLVRWEGGEQTWETEKQLLWREPSQKIASDHSAAARKRERGSAAAMTALRREMQAAKREESRPRDLREAIERDLQRTGRRLKSLLSANSKSSEDERWWSIAIGGSTDSPDAKATMDRIGRIYEAHVRQTEADLGRRAVDVNLDEQPNEGSSNSTKWQQEEVTSYLPGGKELFRDKDGKWKKRSCVGLDDSDVRNGEAARREANDRDLPETWPRGLVNVNGTPTVGTREAQPELTPLAALAAKRCDRISETDRILRASSHFGVLCSPIDVELTPNHIERLYDRAHLRLNKPAARQDAARLHLAEAKLLTAKQQLLNIAAQARLRSKWHATPQIVTSTVRCPIDAAALRAFARGPEGQRIPINKHGQPYGGTNAQIVERFLNACQIPQHAEHGVVTIRYRHSPLGAALVDAGLVNASREYAINVDKEKDPFHVLSKEMRGLVLGRFGYDFDLSAAHPHVKINMVEPGRAESIHFLRHRKEILEEAGRRLFPALSDDDQKAKAKMLFAAIDMDGSFVGFVHEQQLPAGTSPATLDMQLQDGTHFDMQQYLAWQKEGTEWLWDRLGHNAPGHEGRTGMGSFVEAWLKKNKPKPHPERTLKSYCFQESESYGRMAMVEWAAQQGHAALNLQHDGVVICLRQETTKTHACDAIARACSDACRYLQPVAAKPMIMPAGMSEPMSKQDTDLFVGDVSQSSVATSITYMTAACNLWKDANLGHEQYDAIANPALRGDPVARLFLRDEGFEGQMGVMVGSDNLRVRLGRDERSVMQERALTEGASTGVLESYKAFRCAMDLHAARHFTAAASVDGSLKEDVTKHGRVRRRAAFGVWEGAMPGLDGSAAVVAGMWGGRLPSDWEIADCETYAILAYLKKVIDQSPDPSRERVLVLSDCASALQAIEKVWRECSTRTCKTKERGAMLEAICEMRARLGHVSLMWIPAHRGSSVSAYADALAKTHLGATDLADVETIVIPFVRSRPSVPTCISDYDSEGRLIRGAEESIGRVVMDKRMFRLGKARMGRWVHAELARTLDPSHGPLIDRSFIGRKGHAQEASSWVELTKLFVKRARLERKEDDPVDRMASDCKQLHVVTRARVGKHLGIRGTHDRTWQWQLDDECKRGVTGPATRRGFLGCPCCVRPPDDQLVCRRCHGWCGRGTSGMACGSCDGGGGPARPTEEKSGCRPRLLETATERLRREAVRRDADEAMATGRTKATQLATLRHLWGAECAQQPDVEETAQKMRAALREMATVVRRAGGCGSELHQLLDDAARAMEGTAATRAEANDTAFDKVKRVLAIDLPQPPQLAGGEEGEEKSARDELAKRLTPSLHGLTHIVATAEIAWRDATAATVRRREHQEDAREFLRLVMRSWREVADGRRAGAAHWAARWQSGMAGNLARRVQFSSAHARGESSRMGVLALEYTRLVRGGIIRAAQQSTTLAQRAQTEAVDFKRKAQRMWPGAQGEGREDEQPHAWIEGEGSRMQQGDEASAYRAAKYAQVFAQHGRQETTEHSAAATAKKRTASKAGTREHAESSTSVESTAGSNRRAKAQRSSQESSSRGHNSGASSSEQHDQQIMVQPNRSESAEQRSAVEKQHRGRKRAAGAMSEQAIQRMEAFMVGDSERRNVIGRVQAADGEQYAAAGGQQQEHEQEHGAAEQSARAQRAERREERATATAHVGEAARASDTSLQVRNEKRKFGKKLSQAEEERMAAEQAKRQRDSKEGGRAGDGAGGGAGGGGVGDRVGVG